MKKISVIALMTLLPIYGVMAKNNANMQQQPTYWAVTEVVEMPDNTPVKMRGRIRQNMGEQMYLFEDSTGTIMLEIDEEDWNGNTVRVDDVVTIYGTVDKSGRVAEIDVSSIEK